MATPGRGSSQAWPASTLAVGGNSHEGERKLMRSHLQAQLRSLAVFIVPALLLCGLGVYVVQQQTMLHAHALQCIEIGQLAHNATSLLHQTQQEWRITTLYVATVNLSNSSNTSASPLSTVNSFTAALFEQWDLTDTALAEFRGFVGSLRRVPPEVRQTAQSLLSLFTTLPAFRQRVFVCQVNSTEALAVFGTIDSAVLHFVASVSEYSVEPFVIRGLHLYWRWSAYRENVGRETLLGARAIQRGGFLTTARFASFMNYTSRREILLDTFLTFADQNVLEFYYSLAHSNPNLPTLERMRSTLISGNDSVIATLSMDVWLGVCNDLISRTDKMEEFVLNLLLVHLQDGARVVTHRLALVYTMIAAVPITLALLARRLVIEARQRILAERTALYISLMQLEAVPPLPKRPSPLESVLHTIAANLRVYQPYLPNTLFMDYSNSSDTARDTPLLAPGETEILEEGPELNAEQPRESIPEPTGRRLRPTNAMQLSAFFDSNNSHTDRSVREPLSRDASTEALPGAARRISLMRNASSRRLSGGPPAVFSPNVQLALHQRVATVAVLEIPEFCATICMETVARALEYHAQYVTQAEAIVHSERGVIHRFVGDRLFCSWNACSRTASHAQGACNAVLKCQKAVRAMQPKADSIELNPLLAQHPPKRAQLELHAAICTGSLFCGNMGSVSAQTFSVLGPAVEAAHCLVLLNTRLGTRVLCDATTRTAAKYAFDLRLVDRVSFPSTTSAAVTDSAEAEEIFPVCVYEVIREKISVEAEWMYTLKTTVSSQFETAGKAFLLKGDLTSAVQCLTQHMSAHATDTVAARWLSRCRRLIETTTDARPAGPFLRPWQGWHPEGFWTM
eukprot:TRINITY_DN10250_c0_g1_i1.p1 TRINITY_DN10250_c0_g1~~TRINITY_DN10250_c0_g1_i1.p1  ORF type:complete len:861 (+),score=106.65 TRINITY_DN10250_c0_g1_i1:27-2585(+)